MVMSWNENWGFVTKEEGKKDIGKPLAFSTSGLSE